MMNIPFAIICISETKQQVGKDFPVYIRMDGYSMYSQSSKIVVVDVCFLLTPG